MLDPDPVRRISEYGDWHDIDRRRFPRIHDRHGARFPPPGDYRRDIKPAHVDVRGR
jgi:hypothetical protein